jgi:predicted ATPase with chaperone activity
VDLNCGCGDTVIVIVGLPDTAVKESRDRVRTALGNSGFKVPMGRSTINLAPADVKKEGPSFDLPIDKMKTKIHEFAGGESQVGSNYPKPDASNFLNGISARAKMV